LSVRQLIGRASQAWSIGHSAAARIRTFRPKRCFALFREERSMGARKSAILFLAGLAGIITTASAQTLAEPICRPVLTVTAAKLSEMVAPSLERKWRAEVSVDASRCANASGHVEIGVIRAKENAPDEEFVVPFTWQAPSTQVSIDLWADEAIEGHWFNISPCACSR
jgi:hypothetical protein